MRSRSASRRPFRPVVEALEGRALLSVCTVDRLTDLGEGTGLAGDLRYCITQAQDGDRIQFGVQGIISLTAVLPDLTRSVAVEGPGANLLTVRRGVGGNYRVFTVAAAATVSLSGLTVANGNVGVGSGGGISNAGTLTITASTIAGNTARTGGGILNSGTLTIVSTTLTNNTAMASLSPVAGGGIFNTGTLTIANSTVSGNRASVGEGTSSAGGIANPSGSMSVVNSTITANQATFTAGSSVGGGMTIGVNTRLRNTIVAGNAARFGPDLSGMLAASGYNLFGSTNAASGFVATDLLNVDPLLGSLQNHGGPTSTHALLSGSPALDAGDPAAGYNLGFPKWDQRGPGFWRIAGGRLDIGAFEVQGRSGEAGTPFAWGSADWAGIMATAVQRPAVAAAPREVAKGPILMFVPGLTDDPVLRHLVEGSARTLDEAEELYLDSSLPELLRLLSSPLSDEELAEHPLLTLLRVRGSRPREDSLL